MVKARRGETAEVSLQGQLLIRDRRRKAALFLHEGSLWVADFIDGKGGIVDAASWVRFNCSAPSSARFVVRPARARTHALSPQLAATIGLLLQASASSPNEVDSANEKRCMEHDDA